MDVLTVSSWCWRGQLRARAFLQQRHQCNTLEGAIAEGDISLQCLFIWMACTSKSGHAFQCSSLNASRITSMDVEVRRSSEFTMFTPRSACT